MNEEDVKNLLKEKYDNNEFKYDKKTNQKYIEIINANFISETGYIVFHKHHVTDEQWYIDNYEPLLGKQIDNVIKAIKKDPNTRQAYIGMLTPKGYWRNKDKICTIGMQVIYNQATKTVDYIVNMRSNNVCEYTQDSLWQTKIFTQIINRLITEVDKGIKPGKLYWNVGSLHLYEEDFNDLLNDNGAFRSLMNEIIKYKTNMK
jgi:thymidylate synthase